MNGKGFGDRASAADGGVGAADYLNKICSKATVFAQQIYGGTDAVINILAQKNNARLI